MPEPSPGGGLNRHDVRRLLTGRLAHETETSLYILLSVLDFFLTYTLLTTGGGGVQFVEANPVARWFLDHYGVVKGLLGFKLAVVLLVCVIAQVVTMKSPRTGRALLWLGCAVTGWVVLYSVRLLAGSLV